MRRAKRHPGRGRRPPGSSRRRPSSRRSSTRASRDAGIELVCLAGFMRVLSRRLRRGLARPHPQHPPFAAAALPRPEHARARARGRRQDARRDGAFRPRRDRSRARSSRRRPCRSSPGDTPETLAARVLEVEHRLYPLALELVASGDARGSAALLRERGTARSTARAAKRLSSSADPRSEARSEDPGDQREIVPSLGSRVSASLRPRMTPQGGA